MKIGTRVIVSMAVFLLIVAVIAASLFVMTGRVQQINDRLEQANLMVRDANSLSQLTYDYLHSPGERQRTQWEAVNADITARLDGLENGSAEEQEIAGSIRADQQHLRDIFAGVVNASAGTGTAAENRAVPESAWERMGVQNQELLFDASRLAQHLRNEADATRETYSLLIALSLGTIVLFLLINYLLVYRRVLEAVGDLRQGTGVISGGDLTYRIPEEGHDEFQDLAASFNAMTASRHRAEEDLQQKNTDLEAAYEEIKATEEELRKNYDVIAQSEQALRESEGRLRRFYDAGLFGVISWTTDGRILDANDAFLAMTGYTRADLDGGRIDWAAMTPPEFQARDEASLAEIREHGRNRVPFEKEYYRKDGSRVPVLIAGALADEQQMHGVAFVLDITDLREARAHLAAERERHRELLNNIPIGVSRSTPGPGGKIVAANPAMLRIFDAASPDELMAMPPEKLYADPEDRRKFVEAMIRDGSVTGMEVRYRSCRGRPFWGRISSRRWTADDGSVFFDNTVEDISDRKAAEEEIERKNTDLEAAYEEITAAEEELRGNYDALIQSERALRDSEARYRLIAENTGDVIWLLDPARERFTYVSPSVRKLRGYTPVEVLSQPMNEVLTPASYETIRAELPLRIARFLAGNEKERTTVHEVDQVCRDGSVVPTEVSTTILTDDQGAITGILGVSRDITDRKKAEAALRENEEILRLFIEHAPAALAMFDRKMQYLAASRRWMMDYGLGNRDIRGISHYAIFPEITEPWKDVHMRGLAGEVVSNPEDRFVRQDGTVQYLSWEVRPWYTAGGEVGGIIIFSEETTERVAAREALRESQARLHAALESMTDAVFISDVNGTFVEFNEAFATFHKFADKAACRKTLAEYPDFLEVSFPDGTVAPLDMWAVPRALRGETETNAEYHLRRKDTGESWVGSYSFAPIRDKDGKITGSVVVGRDITEWKEAQVALRDSEARFRQFFEKNNAVMLMVEPAGGNILDANPSATAFYGYSRNELCRMNIGEINQLPEEEISRMRREIAGGTRQSFIAPHRLADGRVRTVEVYSSPVRVAGTVSLFSIIHDITDRKVAEEALVASEERFRQFFEKNYAVILVIDPASGRIVDANPAAEAFYGYPQGILKTLNVKDINTMPPEEIGGIFARVCRGELHVIRVPHRLADGQDRKVEIHATPVMTGSGLRLFAIITDITEQEAARAALMESEERYRVIFENRGVGIIVVDTVTKKHIYVNTALASLLGYTVPELEQMSIMDIHPLKDREMVMTEFGAIVSGQKGMATAIPVLRKDGKIRFVDITASAIIISNHRYFAGFFIDVTDRLAAESALRESEERLRLAQDAANAGAWEWNLDTNENYWSPKVFGLYGLDPANVAATYDSWLASIHADYRSAAAAAIGEAVKAGVPIHAEWRVNLPDRQERWLMSRGQPVTGSDGRVHKYRGIVLDITERKRAEREREALIRDLRQKNDELERFTYTVSHDLKTPLITILGYAGLLEDDLDAGNTDEVKATIRRIEAAAHKMEELLADVLKLSRIGRIVAPPEETSLSSIAKEAFGLVAIPLQQRGVQVEIDPEMPRVYVDKNRIQEVLVNLIENAVKYMGDQPDPRIHVGVSREGSVPRFFVRDNGMGVPPAYLERIFNLFEKLDPQTPGSGVGLTIVKRIIEIHGGKIWAESEGPGKGTTLWFTLPGTAPPDPGAPPGTRGDTHD